MKAYLNEVLSGRPPILDVEDHLGPGQCLLDTAEQSTPLHEVASRSTATLAPALVLMLGSRYANVLEQDVRGATALHVAAHAGSYSVAAALCDQAQQFGVLSALLELREGDAEHGGTALDAAEVAGHWLVARLLRRLGAPRSRSPQAVLCPSAALDAVLLGDVEELQRVFAEGAAATASPGGEGALSFNLSQTESLIEAADRTANGSTLGSCVVAPADLGQTLLHVAVAIAEVPPLEDPSIGRRLGAEASALAEVLLAGSDSAAQPDAAGDLPHVAAARSNQADLLTLLLVRGGAAHVNSRNSMGRTVLHDASKAGAADSVRVLLSFGAMPWIVDDSGLTALDYARAEGHTRAASHIEQGLALQSAPGGDVFAHNDYLNDGDYFDEGKGLWAILTPIVGGVVGAVAVALVAYFVWQRSRKTNKAAVTALPAGEAAMEKGAGGSGGASSLRAAGHARKAQASGRDPDEWQVPFGPVIGSDSSEDEHSRLGSSGGGGRGTRRQRCQPPAAMAADPVVVVAPDSPATARSRIGRGSPGGGGGGGGGDSAEAPSPGGRGGGWLGEAAAKPRDKPMPVELVGQLRKELRQREKAPDDASPGSASRSPAGDGPSPPPGRSSRRAHAARLATPPMDTSEPSSTRPSSGDQPAKRAHWAPAEPPHGARGGGDRVAGGRDAAAVPAALEGHDRGVMLPAALQGQPRPPPKR